jgi:ribosomal 50S subunit-recycling heat shock protein
MFMRRTGFALLAGVLVLSIAAGGWAAEPAGTSPAKKVEPPSWRTSSVVEETATVEAIDQSTRMVTLKGPKGNSVTFKAGEQVRNLAQVKVGDEVKFAYYESIAVRVLKKGEAFPTAGEMGAMARAKKGEMPAGVVGKAVAANATITAIDMAAKTATLKGEDGKTVTVTPLRPEKLKEVKVGDRLVITYTEAVAVKVEKAEKKK